MMVEQDTANITEDEAALYDRQIRLWGLDAQKRLRASRVLLIGVGGLGAEVAKNIVLSGIKSLTLLDHLVVTEEDACAQFLVDRADVGKNRAESSLQRTQQLNPMVEISADTAPITTKDEAFLKNFDVVCATCCPLEEISRIDKICHQNKILFFAGDVFGYYGLMFSDLGEHHYAAEVADRKKPPPADGEPAAKKAKGEDETKTVKKIESYTRLQEALDIDWSAEDYAKRLKRTPNTYFICRVLYAFREKFKRDPTTKSLSGDKEELVELRDSVTSSLKVSPDLVPEDFHHFCFAELSPVCAVTGGVLGQEIIKAVSQKDGPHNNFFFYNGIDGSGMVDRIA